MEFYTDQGEEISHYCPRNWRRLLCGLFPEPSLVNFRDAYGEAAPPKPTRHPGQGR